MTHIKAYAAHDAKSELVPFSYQVGDLGVGEVEIKVHYCGICHSDLSMLDNDWQFTRYPIVPGHEVVGEVVALGSHVNHLNLGQKVGLGWYSGSCMSCHPCMSGQHNHCTDSEQTIVGRHGGFADRIRCHWSWAIPLPKGLTLASAGPLFCGGITVFEPIAFCNVKPTDRVGVVGIGGLGHLALQFLNKWGCHVTAFTSSADKGEQARTMGAHAIANSRDHQQLKELAGTLDFLLVTVNVTLNWELYLGCLKPMGRFHVVGGVLAPMEIPAFSLIGGQRSVSGSPLGSPATTATMLDFCQRHGIAPVIEEYPMSQVNQAMQHLREGKARYRIVLKNDF